MPRGVEVKSVLNKTNAETHGFWMTIRSIHSVRAHLISCIVILWSKDGEVMEDNLSVKINAFDILENN
jgi:hypothetical protein